MRGVAAGGLASLSVVAGCTLGVVDIPAGPTPAELRVTSEFRADPSDASLVRIVVRASLDPGIGLDGAPRRIERTVLGVGGSDYEPASAPDPSHPTWLATGSYAAPGPEGVPLRLPILAGLGLAQGINMRVRVEATPGTTILLGRGEDLVLTAEPPSNPAQTLEWSLDLTSASLPDFRVQRGGDDAWPAEVRIPADELPPSAFPIRAEVRVRWDRSLSVFELTPAERYDLSLTSVMVLDWTVESEG